jgi:hypothetical protein
MIAPRGAGRERLMMPGSFSYRCGGFGFPPRTVKNDVEHVLSKFRIPV